MLLDFCDLLDVVVVVLDAPAGALDGVAEVAASEPAADEAAADESAGAPLASEVVVVVLVVVSDEAAVTDGSGFFSHAPRLMANETAIMAAKVLR